MDSRQCFPECSKKQRNNMNQMKQMHLDAAWLNLVGALRITPESVKNTQALAEAFQHLDDTRKQAGLPDIEDVLKMEMTQVQ